MSKTKGKGLEKAIESSFRRVQGCSWVVNWNDAQIPATLRPADVQACVSGLSVLIECKETRSPRISLDVIDDKQFGSGRKNTNNQRRSLMKHAKSGGLSLIVVEHRRGPGKKSRCFLTTWKHWEALRRLYGSEPKPRKSIPLTDDKRPTSLHEVGRSTSSDFISTWDIEATVHALHAEAQELPVIDYRYH